MTYKAILTKSWSLQPEIIEVDFEIKKHGGEDWIYPIPGVTGFESAPLKKLVEEYINEPVFSKWTACGGTLNKYDRLEIPISEIIRWLEETKQITVERDWGYIKSIIWNDCLTQKVIEE